VEVFLSRGGDDVIAVGHEDDVVDENVIFFGRFLQGVKDDADGLSLIESRR
jgi:hypothetical protein